MKKLITLLLSATILFTGCSSSIIESNPTESSAISSSDEISSVETASSSGEIEAELLANIDVDVNSFTGLNDTNLHRYIEDSVYAELVYKLDSDDYFVENVNAVYISQEYLDEVAFNSQSNIYFGYTLAELNELFEGKKYVFTLGEDGKTEVREMNEIADTDNETILKNVAIGTGVILICVTVSLVAAPAAPAVSIIFTTAAKTAAISAASSAAIGGVSAGVVRGIETGDMNEALEAAALGASEGYKWGAISGAVTGGSAKALSVYRANRVIPTPRESELKVLSITDDAIEQVSYLNGKQVDYFTKGATRPDVVVQNPNGTIKAIEVKNYNLESYASRNGLYNELERQVTNRVKNLPKGSTQEIVLDVRGRGFSKQLIDSVISSIKDRCSNVYTDIPVRVISY